MAPKAPTLPTAEEIGTLVPIGRIAKETPYSPDFLRQLARSGKIRAFKLHRDWMTTPDAVRDYIKSQTKRHEKALSLLQAAEKAFLALALMLIVFSATPKARAQNLNNPPPRNVGRLSIVLTRTLADVLNLTAEIHANFQYTKAALLPPLDGAASLLADSFRLGRFQLDTVSAQIATNIEGVTTAGRSALADLARPFLIDVPDYALVNIHHRFPIMPRGPEPTYFETANVAQSQQPAVLGTNTSVEATAALSTQIQTFITQTLQSMLARGLLTGPKGEKGDSGLAPGFSGSSGIVQNDNGKTTAVVGGTPLVSYFQPAPSQNFTGGSLAGFTTLSGQNFTANTANVSGTLTVLGSSSFTSGAFTALSAASSTLAALTVSGPATFSGNTTIAGLTLTGTTSVATLTTTGNVGIGTNTPTAKLFIDASTGTITPLAIKTSGSAGNYTATNSGIFMYDAAGTETLRIVATDPDPSGNNYNTWNLYIGNKAGFSQPSDNTSAGYFNTGVGYKALYSNTEGNGNNAFGIESLYSNTEGVGNNAFGDYPLYSNTEGEQNNAFGNYALWSNISGYGNNVIGEAAGFDVTGDGNTLFGYQAGNRVSTGSKNILIGFSDIAASYGQVTTGSNNISIGNDVAVASSTASNQLNIGNLIYGTGLDGTGATLSTGNIGIGTTNPLYKLEVVGFSKVTGMSVGSVASVSNDGQIIVQNSGTAAAADIDVKAGGGHLNVTNYGSAYVGNNSFGVAAANTAEISTGQNALYFGNWNAGPVYLYAGGVRNMTLATSGNVGIGTATPSQLLTVYGNLLVATSSTPALFVNTATGKVGIGTSSPQNLLHVGSASVASGTVARFQNVNGSCDINPTNASLQCSSDQRLKQNVNTMGNMLGQVLKLNPVYFNWTSEDSSTPQHPGFIAQEVEAVFPELVTTDAFGFKSIGYSNFVPYLVSSVQVLDQRIAALQGSFGGNATTSNLTVYNPANFSGDSVGEARILTGQTSVRVTFTQPYTQQPIVTVTPEDQTATGEFVTDRDSSGFTIRVPVAVTSDITFAWHSFASPAARLTVSDGSTASIVLIVSPSPPAPESVLPTETPPDPPSETSTSTPPRAVDADTDPTPTSDPEVSQSPPTDRATTPPAPDASSAPPAPSPVSNEDSSVGG